MQLVIKPPEMADRQAVLTFRREFMTVHAVLHGANELNAFTDEGYASWLGYMALPAGTRLFEYAKVADSTYIALRGEVMVGIVHVRHYLNEGLRRFGGHVGYSTHPAYQGQGIATQLLCFALARLDELGETPVLVTCGDDNPASQRVIERCGGVLENIIRLDTPGHGSRAVCRYWIDTGKMKDIP